MRPLHSNNSHNINRFCTSEATHERVIKTLNVWNVKIDEAFGANIFFDDQDVYLDTSSKLVPSAKVICKSIEESKK